MISIHAPREGGDERGACRHDGLHISIHAPREGGDYKEWETDTKALYISIHAPREGGDYFTNFLACIPYNFNPRPPRGGRHRGEF